jgi:hypothetical protein
MFSMQVIDKTVQMVADHRAPFTLVDKVDANHIFIIMQRALGNDQSHVDELPYPGVVHFNRRNGHCVAITETKQVLY